MDIKVEDPDNDSSALDKIQTRNFEDEDELDGDELGREELSMPEEVKKIVQERLKQTSKEKDNANAKTDMYLEDFKKNFGAMESRNAANRSNKPIASQLDKSGGKLASGIRKNLRILDDDDSDEDDKLLGKDTKD